jgi:hypothetical protein
MGTSCITDGMGAIHYHAKLVKEKVIVYDEHCDFLGSRRLRPEIRAKYAELDESVGRSKPPRSSESKFPFNNPY